MASCDKSFSNSYLLLSPEEVGLIDLFRLLFSTNLEQRKFVDSSQEREESFGRRWIIFVSIVVQKLLLTVAEPLSATGSAIELWLNLVRSNGSLGSLFANFIRGKCTGNPLPLCAFLDLGPKSRKLILGKVVMPDKQSADFVSFIGNLDMRVGFDRNILPGDEKYYMHLSMMAAKASYENEAYLKSNVTDQWKMEFLGSYDFWNEYQDEASTQAFMMRDENPEGDVIVVAFRGTEPFNSKDWCSDFDISWYDLPRMGTTHGGFMKALGLQKNLGWPKEISSDSHDIANGNNTNDNHRRPPAYYFLREKLRALLLEHSRSRYIVTGHSLGGALAVLFPAVLALHEEKELLDRLEGVYTFGQPRVGDGEFGKFMEKVMSEHNFGYFRFVYGNDMVPRLPYDNSTFLFKHFGNCLYHDRHYQEQILPEEPNRNYLSMRTAIPMMVNAVYELRRSFTIVSTKGPEYRDSTLLRILRVIGLVIPGIPAHSPMDYNNSIRFGRACRDVTVKQKDR